MIDGARLPDVALIAASRVHERASVGATRQIVAMFLEGLLDDDEALRRAWTALDDVGGLGNDFDGVRAALAAAVQVPSGEEVVTVAGPTPEEACPDCEGVGVFGAAPASDRRYFGGFVDGSGVRHDPCRHAEDCPRNPMVVEKPVLTSLDDERVALIHAGVRRVYRVVLTINGPFLAVDSTEVISQQPSEEPEGAEEAQRRELGTTMMTIDVPCLICGAAPGEPCVVPNGRKILPHRKRHRTARLEADRRGLRLDNTKIPMP